MYDQKSTSFFFFMVGSVILGVILYAFDDPDKILFTTRPGQVIIGYAVVMVTFTLLSFLWRPFAIIPTSMCFVLLMLVFAYFWMMVFHAIVIIWNFDTTHRWYRQ